MKLFCADFQNGLSLLDILSSQVKIFTNNLAPDWLLSFFLCLVAFVKEPVYLRDVRVCFGEFFKHLQVSIYSEKQCGCRVLEMSVKLTGSCRLLFDEDGRMFEEGTV